VELTDALTVAIAGMSVVFFGLILTSLIISAFSFVPNLLESIKNHTKSKSAENQGKVVLENVDPDILAVIATVLEVERRLQYSYRVSKFTFKDRQPTSGLV